LDDATWSLSAFLVPSANRYVHPLLAKKQNLGDGVHLQTRHTDNRWPVVFVMYKYKKSVKEQGLIMMSRHALIDKCMLISGCACLPACLSVCLSVGRSVCLFVYLSVGLSVMVESENTACATRQSCWWFMWAQRQLSGQEPHPTHTHETNSFNNFSQILPKITQTTA
jgi:hypothetical protein